MILVYIIKPNKKIVNKFVILGTNCNLCIIKPAVFETVGFVLVYCESTVFVGGKFLDGDGTGFFINFNGAVLTGISDRTGIDKNHIAFEYSELLMSMSEYHDISLFLLSEIGKLHKAFFDSLYMTVSDKEFFAAKGNCQ